MWLPAHYWICCDAIVQLSLQVYVQSMWLIPEFNIKLSSAYCMEGVLTFVSRHSLAQSESGQLAKLDLHGCSPVAAFSRGCSDAFRLS